MEQFTPTLPVRHKNDACCTVVSCSLSEPRTASLAERLKAVADPTRLRLLDMLAQQDGPLCVCDITPHFEQNQPTISHHLKLLRDAGLVETEKRGIWAYYWATQRGRNTLAAVESLQ
jgi:ArsR family transcriptional regulator, arsenate/arsenite/antimonite-responsive transcriptional repressor